MTRAEYILEQVNDHQERIKKIDHSIQQDKEELKRHAKRAAIGTAVGGGLLAAKIGLKKHRNKSYSDISQGLQNKVQSGSSTVGSLAKEAGGAVKRRMGIN